MKNNRVQGDLDATGTITQAGNPVATEDYVDSAVGSSGDFKADGSVPMTGDLNFGGNNGVNLADPTNPQDAATKAYVDFEIGALNSANNTLSNLVSPTAINQDLLPATQYAQDVGSVGNEFGQVHTMVLQAEDVNASGISTLENLVVGTSASFSNTTIEDVADPVNPQDAATKAYVDTNSSGKNYITNGNGENGTTGWVTYNDGSVTRPVDGTGGTATGITFSTTSTNPLRPSNSLTFAKDAANRQGSGVSYDFTIDRADLGKVLKIKKEYIINSGTFVAGTRTTESDVIIYLYDVTNASLIEPSNIKLFSNSTTVPADYESEFQTSIDSLNYRLIVHVASTSALAYQIKFEIAVGPSQYVYGSPETDWASYTPSISGFGTVTNVNFEYRRSGPDMQIRGNFTTGTVTGSIGTLSLANGHTVKSNIPALSVANSTTWFSASGNPGFVNDSQVLMSGGDSGVTFQAAATATKQSGAASNLTVSGVVVNVNFSVPIQGWSSSVQMSDNADTRVVDFIYYKNGGVVLANTALAAYTLGSDTHGTFNPTTGQATIIVAGDYDFVAGANTNLSAQRLDIFVNGAAVARSPVSTNGTVGFSGKIRNLKAGDQIALVNSTGSSITVGADNVSTYFGMTRASGPSAIAATETIACRYSVSANQAITGGVTRINYDAKDFDTHNAVTTGASWAFTAPTAGKYRVSTLFTSNTAGNTGVVFVAGAAKSLTGTTPSNTYVAGSSEIFSLLAGQTIYVIPNATSTMTGPSGSIPTNTINIERVGL